MSKGRAKRHYDVACTHLELAVSALGKGNVNDAIAHTSIADASTRLAQFAAEHQALAAGIPEDDAEPQAKVSHPPHLKPPVW